jgi:hypothetical protein
MPLRKKVVVTWLDYMRLSPKELAKKIKQSKKVYEKS